MCVVGFVHNFIRSFRYEGKTHRYAIVCGSVWMAHAYDNGSDTTDVLFVGFFLLYAHVLPGLVFVIRHIIIIIFVV